MPTDFGIAGSRNYKADLGSIDESKARSLLLAVKTQITGTNGIKSGVLKLVNLEGDGNITLKRKGIMSRMFQRDGADMRTTSEVLKDLFAKAGFSPEIRQELSDYLDRRSSRAGTKTISALIAKGFTGIGAASGDTVREALHKLGVDLSRDGSDPVKGGGRGKVIQATHIAERRLLKINNNATVLKLDGVNARGEPRLDRRNAAGSAYLENRVPGIVRPEIYALIETRADGTETCHAVAGDKYFKRWAADRLASNPGSALAVAGVVMARAKGVEMMDANDKGRPPVVATVTPGVLAAAAVDGLETLKNMSANGFVHGDLKSPNMFIDASTGTLQFIDVDDISKMRKGQNGALPPGYTTSYSHPNVTKGAVGFEQDLMGLGLSILHTALTNRGDAAGANGLLNRVADYNKTFKELVRSGNSASDPDFIKLRTIIEGAVPADASPAEILALNWINAALDQSAPAAVRYGTQNDAEHLLDRVDPRRNPAMAERIDRRTAAVAAAVPKPAAPQRAAPPRPQPAPVQPRPRPVADFPPVANAPAAAPKGLAASVEKALDAAGVIMDRTFPAKTMMAVYQAVEAWTKGIEGRAMMAAAAADARGPDALADGIREVIVDRVNLEHLRFMMSGDPALSALPAESRAILEGQLNRRAVFEAQVLWTPEQLTERIERIRSRMNV